MRLLPTTILLTPFFTLAFGCQVAQQAIEALKPIDASNILQQQEIKSLSALSFGDGRVIARHEGEVLALRVSGQPALSLVSAGADGRVIGWDLGSGKGHETLNLNRPLKLAAIGEIKALVAWADDKGIFVTCIQGCAAQLVLKNFKVRPSSLAFHNDDTTLLIGGTDGRVYRWRFLEEQEVSSMEEREKMVERYIGHHTMVSGVIGHTVGRAFFSSDWDGSLIGWLTYTEDDYQGRYDKNPFRGRFYTDIPANKTAPRQPDRGIASLALSGDGKELGVGTEDGFVEVWKVQGFTLSARQKLHEGRVTGVALASDGSKIASVGKDSLVRVSQITPDPTYALKSGSPPNLVLGISEHTIPAAKSAVFLSSSRVAVSSKTGEIAELTLTDAPMLHPVSAPTTNPTIRDGDY